MVLVWHFGNALWKVAQKQKSALLIGPWAFTVTGVNVCLCQSVLSCPSSAAAAAAYCCSSRRSRLTSAITCVSCRLRLSDVDIVLVVPVSLSLSLSLYVCVCLPVRANVEKLSVRN